jgi:D-3-phosphoglycerate dehydrogenase / 2-oxoglutarate reductase
MKHPKVFITHCPHALSHYYGARALAALQAVAEVHTHRSERELSISELVEMTNGCDIIVSDRVHAGSGALLAQLPQLLAFCRCAVDIRNVDVAAASAHGILVTQASAGFKTSVTEWILGAMVDLSRGISHAARSYHNGQVPVAQMGRELRGSTVGIIGFGQIARTLAPIVRALGMRVLINDPFATIEASDGEAVPLEELLGHSDYVVCLAVATPATENLMNADAFSAMKSTSFFVNASRGNLVDEAALHHALDTGQIAGCALDVGREPDQMPSLELARHPLVIATPHIGGLTPQAIEHQSMETVQQVTTLLQGRMPLGAVNPEHALRLRKWLNQ